MKVKDPKSSIYNGINWSEYSAWPEVTLIQSQDWASHTLNSSSVLVSQDLQANEIINLVVSSGAHHILQKNNAHFDEELKRAGRVVTSPELYFQNGGELLLQNIKEQIHIEFCTKEDKEGMLQKLLQFVEKIHSQNVLESANAIIEELYMNSILDAPREAKKKPGNTLSYESGLKAKMSMYLNNQELVISCEDPFGSLDINKFISRMHEVYELGAGEVINLHEGAGAGLGCVIMFENCKAMFLGVSPGNKTLVSCIIPLGMSYRQRAEVKKSLHLITN